VGGGFDLMFDAVFNHCSSQSDWFRRFLADDPPYRDWFITVEDDPDLSQVVRPRAVPLLTAFQTEAGPRMVWTTFSEDQVDLNVKNPDVLLALIDILLFYVAHGARLIRLDAIAYLWKEIGTSCIHLPQTHRAIQLMRTVLDEVASEVLLITETNVPHLDNVSYFGDGSNEAQLVYNFALPPLILHSIATGNGEALSRWAASLDLPSTGVTFFNFLASHDGIGINPVRGILSPEEIGSLIERVEAHRGFVSYKSNPDGTQSPYELNINYFDALSNPAAGEPLDTQVARFMVAHAIQLAMAGVPGIYFHSLFGSRGDRRGAEGSGIKRRINRQKLSRADLERDLADPSTRRSRVLTAFSRFMAARRSTGAFHPSGRQRVLTVDPRVFALLRESPGGGEAAICLHNLAAEPVAIDAGLEPSVREAAERQGLLEGGRLRGQLGPYGVQWKLGGSQPAVETLPRRAALE
jgi:sucrose phosphorylase